MDLYHNDQADFTRWVVANAYLQEPFVAIDVGVQGGEHIRWGLLGDRVRVYGFDALSEAIDRITAQGRRPNRVYRAMAIGNEDGEREFSFPKTRFASSFTRSDVTSETSHGDGVVGTRLVPIRRLDTLFAQGELPAADYIKIDCEGYDPEVLRGAQTYLAQSNILSVTVETNFDPSPRYPRTAFAEINDLLVAHRLAIFVHQLRARTAPRIRGGSRAASLATTRSHARCAGAGCGKAHRLRFSFLPRFCGGGRRPRPARKLARSYNRADRRQAHQEHDQLRAA